MQILNFFLSVYPVKLVRNNMNFQRHFFQECGSARISIIILQKNWKNAAQSVVYRYEHTVCCHSVAFQLVEFSYMSLRPLHRTLRLYHSECGNILKKLSVLLGGVWRMCISTGRCQSVYSGSLVLRGLHYSRSIESDITIRLRILKLRLIQSFNYRR
jgi:hypothetical protein